MTTRRSRITKKVLLLAACLPLSGFADEPVDLFSLSLEELAQVRITTSTLSEETQQSVPASVTVYTREDIRSLGIERLADVMNLVPGYQSSRSDSYSLNRAFSARGRRLGSAGAEVLVLLDGQRLNSDWNGGANLFDSRIPLDDVERVEFIRGPGSTLYGSNAMMGVVNVITRRGRELKLQAGSHHAQQVAGQWYWGDEHRNLQLSVDDGRDEGEALHIYDPAVQHDVASRDPFRYSDVYLRGHWEQGSDAFSMRLRSAERDSRRFYAVGFIEDEQNRVETDSRFVDADWNHALSDELNLTAQLSYSDRQYHVRSAALLSPYVLVDGGIKEREPAAKLLLQDDEGAHRWLLGWEYRQPELYDTDAYINGALFPQAPETSRRIVGHFAQYQWQFRDDTNLIAGLREDIYSDFGRHVSPRLGLIHQRDHHNTWKLLYSEAFRAPSRIETDVINSGAFVRNPALKPEVASTVELVWLNRFAAGQFSTSLFHTKVDDAIHEMAYGVGNLRTWQNSHEAEVGLEVEWQQALSADWTARVAVTDVFNSPSSVNSEAEVLFGGSLVYERGPWLASVRANYQGARRDSTEENGNPATLEYRATGGRTLVGAHLAYRVRPDFELYLTAENLTDRHFNAPATRYSNLEGVPERGRTLMAGLRWRFD